MALAAYEYPPVEMPRTVWRSNCPTPWKDSFDTKFEANQVAAQIVRRHRYSKSRCRPQRAYSCRCGKAHLTGTSMRY